MVDGCTGCFARGLYIGGIAVSLPLEAYLVYTEVLNKYEQIISISLPEPSTMAAIIGIPLVAIAGKRVLFGGKKSDEGSDTPDVATSPDFISENSVQEPQDLESRTDNGSFNLLNNLTPNFTSKVILGTYASFAAFGGILGYGAGWINTNIF